MILVIVAQIIIYVNQVVHVSLFELEDFDSYCSYLIYSPFRRAEIWRFFSYMFIHCNLQHFLTNICIQMLVCIIVVDFALYCRGY